MLLLDGGNVSSGRDEVGDIKADFYGGAYPILGYDAVGIGNYEVEFMRETGRRNLYGTSVPLISANVVDAETGKSIGDELWIIKSMSNGLRVGIISVIQERLVPEVTQRRLKVKVIPIEQALKEHVPTLQKKCDVVVVLCQSDFAVAKTLASAVGGIHAVLVSTTEQRQGSSAEYWQKEYYKGLGPEKVGDTIVMCSRTESLSLAKLSLDIDKQGHVASYEAEYLPVEPSLASHPGIEKLMEQYAMDIADYNERHPMTLFPGSNQGLAPWAALMVKDRRQFVSVSECAKCHKREFESWRRTRHASAFASLRAAGQQRDPECVQCHTTGYGQMGGFRSEASPPDLTGVQCESCHGPGLAHVRNPKAGYGELPMFTCLTCHDKKNSPGFQAAEYNWRVSHMKK